MITIDPIIGILTATTIGAVYGIVVAMRRNKALLDREPAFNAWWHYTGSAIHPMPCEDAEAHTKRVAARAWDAGFAQRDAA